MHDLISRQAAIDEIDEWIKAFRENGHKESSADACLIQDGIIQLPSVQPEQWIPCSERLPEDLAEVNVTWVNHKPESYYGFMKDKPMTATAVYYRGKWYWFSCLCTDMLSEYGKNPLDQMDDAIEVIAWMSLPEPYKGEQE